MKTCLVVDDSRTVRSLARRLLESQGLRVREAGDGGEALEMCASEMPDAILLDWHMPVMSGPDFLAILRASPAGDAPKVIFCSAENDLDHIALALACGGDEYIMKPFDDEILRDKLVQVGVL